MPPLGLISIGGYLKMHGYMVEILDLFTNHIRKQEFIDKIKNRSYAPILLLRNI